MIKPQGFYTGLRFVRAQNHLCPWVARARAKKLIKIRETIVQKKRQKSTGITLTFTHTGVKMIKPLGFYRGLRVVRAPNHLFLWVARAKAKKGTKSRGIIVQKKRQKSTGINGTFTHKGVKMIKPQGFYRGLRFVRAQNHLFLSKFTFLPHAS